MAACVPNLGTFFIFLFFLFLFLFFFFFFFVFVLFFVFFGEWPRHLGHSADLQSDPPLWFQLSKLFLSIHIVHRVLSTEYTWEAIYSGCKENTVYVLRGCRHNPPIIVFSLMQKPGLMNQIPRLLHQEASSARIVALNFGPIK